MGVCKGRGLDSSGKDDGRGEVWDGNREGMGTVIRNG